MAKKNTKHGEGFSMEEEIINSTPDESILCQEIKTLRKIATLDRETLILVSNSSKEVGYNLDAFRSSTNANITQLAKDLAIVKEHNNNSVNNINLRLHEQDKQLTSIIEEINTINDKEYINRIYDRLNAIEIDLTVKENKSVQIVAVIPNLVAETSTLCKERSYNLIQKAEASFTNEYNNVKNKYIEELKEIIIKLAIEKDRA